MLTVAATQDATAQVFQGLAIDDSTRKPIARYPVVLVRRYSADEAIAGRVKTDLRGLFQIVAPEPGIYQLEFGDSLRSIAHGPVDTVAADTIVVRQYAIHQRRRSLEEIHLEFEVEEPVVPLTGTAAPQYPNLLRELGMCGEVLASFVVDTAGRVDMQTFRVLRSNDALFTEAVREGTAKARYRAAQRSGRPVRQMVQQPFTFSIMSTRAGACPTSRWEAEEEICKARARGRPDTAYVPKFGCRESTFDAVRRRVSVGR